jgi:spermidine synthase
VAPLLRSDPVEDAADAQDPTGGAPFRGVAVAALFLASGAAGLVYEVAWSRQLAHVLGGAYPAMAATVACFLGGLALGARLGARAAARTERPLRLYGMLEAAIGVYALLFPALLAAAGPIHGWLYRACEGSPALHLASNVAVAAILLLPPTAAMGATLPLLVREAAPTRAGVLGSTALLYGINTVGAAAGALAAGFLLLPEAGLRGTLAIAAGINLAVAALAILLDRAAPHPAAPAEEPREPGAAGEGPPPGLRRLLLGTAAATGAAAMVHQLGWTKALVLVLGSSVHAFTLIVATFILGLGLGGLAAPLCRGEGRGRWAWIALLQAGVGASALGSVGIIADLPIETIVAVGDRAGDYGSVLLWQGGVVARLVLLPSLALGALFPLLVAAVAEGGGAAAAASVGRVYGWNTAGTILGALGGGLLLLPVLGIRGALVAAAGTNLALAAVAAATAARGPAARAAAAAAVAGAGLLLALRAPPWPPERMNCGPYLYGEIYRSRARMQDRTLDRVVREAGWDIPFLREGRSGTVAVGRSVEGDLYLRINGKTDASTGGDMSTQLLLGHLPCLAHPAPRSALVIGLASGVSAAAVASHGIGRIDILEISPEVAEASRLFDGVNGGVTRREGVRVILEDGRKHVEHARETYDVIVSEPTNPWIAGVSNLFTEEYFRACRERLSEDGVLCVWLQAYSISLEDFRRVVRTVRAVFPSATVWETAADMDFAILATRDDGADAAARIAARGIPGGPATASLAEAGVVHPAAILALGFLDREATGRFAGTGDLHTDDRLQLEFSTPRFVFGDRRGTPPADGRTLDGFRSFAPPPGADREFLARAVAARAAKRAVGRALEENPAEPDLSEGIRRMEEALASFPGDHSGAAPLQAARIRRGEIRLQAGDLAGAAEDFERARSLRPSNAIPWLFLARIVAEPAAGRPDDPRLAEAHRLVDASLARSPGFEEALSYRGVLHALRGDDVRAEEAFRAGLRTRPDGARLWANLGRLRIFQGRPLEALTMADAGLAFEPRNADLLTVRREAEAAMAGPPRRR